MMDNNYQYSKELLHYCLEREIPFLYASSAATYGGRTSDFIESREYEQPLNVYGYSKFPVRRIRPPDPAGSQFADRRLPLTLTSTGRAKATKAAWRASLSTSIPAE